MFSLSAEHQEFYYYNTQSGASQWEHPVDVWCRHVTSLHRQAKTRAHTGQIIDAKREQFINSYFVYEQLFNYMLLIDMEISNIH